MLIPARNLRHLMLDTAVVDAVAQGRFHIHTAARVDEGLAFMTGLASGLPTAAGEPMDYAPDSVLGRAAHTLRAYRRACHRAAGSSRMRRT